MSSQLAGTAALERGPDIQIAVNTVFAYQYSASAISLMPLRSSQSSSATEWMTLFCLSLHRKCKTLCKQWQYIRLSRYAFPVENRSRVDGYKSPEL